MPRERSDDAAAVSLGAADYITKSFSPAELVRRLEAVLERSAYRDGGSA
jgi:DNA-binding response OmpR family regulator